MAQSLGLGASAWYADWRPAIAEWLTGTSRTWPTPSLYGSYTMPASFLTGPVFSLKSAKGTTWSNSVYFGQYHLKTTSLLSMASLVLPKVARQPIEKYDADSSITTPLNKWLSLFFGIKYQRYRIKDWIAMGGAVPMLQKESITNNTLGTGMGLGFTIPIVSGLFVLINGSALYQGALLDYHTRILIYSSTFNTMVPASAAQRILNHGVGANTSASLAYYIQPMRTTIALGFRYQFIHFFPGIGTSGGFRIIEKRNDHFYGAALSVVHVISLTRRPEPEPSVDKPEGAIRKEERKNSTVTGE